MDYTLNCNGRLVSVGEPLVMGILNATPDSFFAGSRRQTEADIATRTEQILREGGAIIDVGACSTRPGGEAVGEAEETARLRLALRTVRQVAPQAVVSVDTFRPDVARMAVEEFGADIINDVGGGQSSFLSSSPSSLLLSPSSLLQKVSPMFRMVSRLRVPYIYMSRQPTVRDILLDCAAAVDALRAIGQKDIMVDPGFGFGKTIEQNYALLNDLERMHALELPVLVGLSRKSMIYRLLRGNPEQALNGTTALNTIALMKGASILRVHDVSEAVECVRLVAAVRDRDIVAALQRGREL